MTKLVHQQFGMLAWNHEAPQRVNQLENQLAITMPRFDKLGITPI
jgi:hypothetical protein